MCSLRLSSLILSRLSAYLLRLRRSKEKDVDYESQIPFLVAHKAQAAVKRDVHDVALVLQSELEASGIEAVERVVVSNKDILHFRVR